MATTKHPITGVTLNDIDVKRQSLSDADAVTAWLMRLQGTNFTEVVQKLGTNANRVGEVFRGEKYPEAHAKAISLLRKGRKIML